MKISEAPVGYRVDAVSDAELRAIVGALRIAADQYKKDAGLFRKVAEGIGSDPTNQHAKAGNIRTAEAFENQQDEAARLADEITEAIG